MKNNLYEGYDGTQIEIIEDNQKYYWKKPIWKLWKGPYESKFEALLQAAHFQQKSGAEMDFIPIYRN